MTISATFAKYAEYYDLFHHKKPYRKECEFVYKWADKPKSILDLGCGTAQYWKYWPKVDINGAELSQAMINKSPYKSKIFQCDAQNLPPFKREYDLVTMLFDVINYIPAHDWWARLPLKKGGFLIFDIWDAEKIKRQGFTHSLRKFDGISRKVTPLHFTWSRDIELKIQINDGVSQFSENHKMYLYSHDDLLEFAGNAFHLIDIKETQSWQKWYKFQKR